MDYSKFPEGTTKNLAVLPKFFLSLESKDYALSLFGSLKKSRKFVFSFNICDKYLICDILVMGNITNRDTKKNILIVNRVLLSIFGSSKRCFSKKYTLHRR